MKKTGIIALSIVVVLALAGGVFALSRKHNDTTSSPNTTPASSADSNTPSSAASSAPTVTTPTAANTITYSDNGFSPATLTVKAGSQVTIKNDSSQILQFDSDPHPQHTDDPELNVGTIAPGHSQTITVTKTGSHGYHNHANADDTGTLIVQ